VTVESNVRSALGPDTPSRRKQAHIDRAMDPVHPLLQYS
jgi:hypothetical protein